MTRPDGRTDMSRAGTRTTAAVTLLALLVLLVGIASSVGGSIIALGVTGLAAGCVALTRGGTTWLPALGRRTGVAVAVAGVLALGLGTACAPTAARTVAAEGAAPSDTAAKRPPASATAPALATPSAAPPVMAMTCPPGQGAAPLFGREITALAPYRVTIEYGDGDRYTNDDQHLGAVFSHTYSRSGSFAVSAVVTDSTGRTATANCTYTWRAGRR